MISAQHHQRMGKKLKKFLGQLDSDLPAAAVKVLKDLAKKRRLTMTAVLRQAIGTEKFIDDVNEDAGKILVEDKRGSVRQLVFR